MKLRKLRKYRKGMSTQPLSEQAGAKGQAKAGNRTVYAPLRYWCFVTESKNQIFL